MPDNSLRVVARIKAKPDSVSDVQKILKQLIEPTLREAGCISYVLLQNRKDSTDFTFVEEWAGDSAFEGHLASTHLQNALPKLQDLLVEPPDIRTYTIVD